MAMKQIKEEKVLRNLEDQLGQYAYEICKKYLSDTVDPIEDLEIRNEAKKWAGRDEAQEKDLKRASFGIAIIFSFPGIIVILFWLAFAYDMLQTEIDAFADISNYIPLILSIIWLWIASLIHKGNKARIERRKRIVGKEKNIKIHNQVSIMRLIMRLFGF